MLSHVNKHLVLVPNAAFLILKPQQFCFFFFFKYIYLCMYLHSFTSMFFQIADDID